MVAIIETVIAYLDSAVVNMQAEFIAAAAEKKNDTKPESAKATFAGRLAFNAFGLR
ncbi:MAG: hypothetical protein IAF08_06605 [Rhizobacter sp.]|nr:hypothetical protein [Chlorobiales bacterium]